MPILFSKEADGSHRVVGFPIEKFVFHLDTAQRQVIKDIISCSSLWREGTWTPDEDVPKEVARGEFNNIIKTRDSQGLIYWVPEDNVAKKAFEMLPGLYDHFRIVEIYDNGKTQRIIDGYFPAKGAFASPEEAADFFHTTCRTLYFTEWNNKATDWQKADLYIMRGFSGMYGSEY